MKHILKDIIIGIFFLSLIGLLVFGNSRLEDKRKDNRNINVVQYVIDNKLSLNISC